MKSEQRHKLQQNELADYLAKIVEKVKPYQNAILGGIILVLVLVLLTHWWNKQSTAEIDAANTQFNSALDNAVASRDPSELMGVVKDHPKSQVAVIAALTAADMHLNKGCDLLFQNKAKANAELGSAVDIYQKILPDLNDPFLIANAKYGLARAKESQNQLPEAEKTYAEIVQKWPESPYGVLAARRLEDLKRPATKENYDKFANFDPKPFKDDTPLPGKMPLFDQSNVPQEGPIYTPGAFGEKVGDKTEEKEGLKQEPAKEAAQPAQEEKKAEEKKTEEAKPAANPPAAETAKPVEGEKPADSQKPAEGEKPAETPSTTPPAADTPAPAQNPAPEKTPETPEKGE